MGKLLILILILATLWLLWRAFGPQSRFNSARHEPPAIKGPDDDEDFLWELKKQRFKERRRREQEEGDNKDET